MTSMKNLLLAVAIFLPSIVFSQGSESRDVSSFIKIKVSGGFDVYIESGDKESLRIEGTEFDRKKIQTTVKNGLLKVFVDPEFRGDIHAKVFVTCKSLQGIDRAGSGDLNCKSNISGTSVQLSSAGSGDVVVSGLVKAQQLDISLSGSGDCRVNSVKAEDLGISVSGSGDMDVLSGNVKKQSLGIAGSGDISAFGVVSEACVISIAGSGDVNVTANKSLEATIAGSGEVVYKGSAQVTSSKVVGSGRIRRN